MTRFSISLQQGDVLLSLLLVPAVFLVYSSCCLSTLLRIAPAFALLQSPQPTISGGAGSIIFSQHRAAQPISFSHSTFPSSPSSLSLPQSTRDDVGPVQTGQADDSSRRHVAFLSASPATGLLGAGRENNRSLRPSSSRRSTSPVKTADPAEVLAPVAFSRRRALGVTTLHLTGEVPQIPTGNMAADGASPVPSQLLETSSSKSPALGRRGRRQGKCSSVKGRSSTASAALKALSSSSGFHSLLPGSRAPSAPGTCKNRNRVGSLKRKATSLKASKGQHFGKGKGGGGRGGPSSRRSGAAAGVRRIEEEDDEDFEGEDDDDEDYEDDLEDEDEDDEDLEGDEDVDEEEEEEEDEDEEYDPMTPRGPLDSNNYGEVWLPVQARPRRNRRSRAVRQLVQETVLKPSSLIYPLFVHNADVSVPIASMPGQKRLSMADLLKEVGEAKRYGVNAFMLFPKVDDGLKTNMGEESYNPDGLLPRAIMALKEAYPDILVLADVALDPYSAAGQDGVVEEETGKVLNDMTVHQLCKQALTLARAGADMVCPSDMMDGRVSAIREALDMEGCIDTGVLSYTCKYASSLYGPFRDALSSHVRPGLDKRTYQMDFSNVREAEREAELDVAEGADMLMVKPGLPYLDVLSKVREKTRLPLAAYHVSGEYAMLKAAAERGWIDEKQAVLESLKGFRRAGADAVATYYAKDVAKWMAEDASGERKFTEPCY